MKIEGGIFAVLTGFFLIVTPIYWFMSEDPTGTTALILSTFLTAMIAVYVLLVARRMGPRPEDREDGEIAENAGEIGFFAPYSWWPLWAAMSLSVCVVGVVFGWWLFIIGAGFGVVALLGWVFEFYRGEHAH